MQLTAIRENVAQLIGNGQDLTVFGDNLFVDLDLSAANLPVGSRIRVGEALVEVSPMPHDGCAKFKQRFGTDALRFVSGKALRAQNLRGIYWTAVEPGEVRVGDTIDVLSRPYRRETRPIAGDKRGDRGGRGQCLGMAAVGPRPHSRVPAL